MQNSSCYICSFCPKLPHIHVQVHCNTNEKRLRRQGLLP